MLQKQAKALTPAQIRTTLRFIADTRFADRNKLIFLLSVKAGLRAKEIAQLKWSMVLDADGAISDLIRLTDSASKGNSGGAIPMARDIRDALSVMKEQDPQTDLDSRIIRTQRSLETDPQFIVNLFFDWYRQLGFLGCSSHSGRRTFITNAARNIGLFGGSIRDVQELARHRSLAMTQRYIEVDSNAMRKVVDA
ncbi:site-specific integrase [uncultured Parasphingorhabdus sp.]|uniref:tyrosine-type recombinase/integrase n=1 Tax=uncultured Parasphingorhabdus sp. TaxID=2709694 RepID=UPI002AA60C8F|nr:site-specific integrase [uncultured Parasphingorhabdus sp.]